MLPVARDNSRIACGPFVNEYKWHKHNLPRGAGLRINQRSS
jgi:hypothetical protein